MKILTIFLLLMISLTVFSSSELETNSFKEIESKVIKMGKKYGVKNVLAVLDIDNTVMQMSQNLGSDQWFGWQQKACIGKKKPANFCATTSFGKLLDLQGKLFALSKMLPTEDVTVSVIKNLQSKGFKVILLTSRGYAYRNSTEIALRANGLNFINSAIGPKLGYAGKYIPYTLANLSASGLTPADAKIVGLKKARSVSYQNGIYMTAGLNKGIMLKTLLHKTGSKFKAIIFADDHKKHTTHMQAIFGQSKDINLTTYRYGKIDGIVKKFHAGEKTKTKKALRALKKVLSNSFL